MKKIIHSIEKYKVGKTIKQYLRARVFWFAFTEILRLGISKISLELLREIVYLKIQKKLKRKYGYVLKNISADFESQKNPRKIWVCWFQGLDRAPDIVKLCIASIKENFKEYELIILTERNFRNYISFPEVIEKRIEMNHITLTHLSDLLRVELLIKYGGIWIDSTVLVTSNSISSEILNADFFMFQELKPGSEGHSLPISSWFIVSKPNHPILLATRSLLYEYWKKNTRLIDYFLLHHFINISKDCFTQLWKRVPRYPNSLPHLLQLELFEEYSEVRLKEIYRLTSIHKLSYKLEKEDIQKDNTFFDKVISKKIDKHTIV
ncbi:capsular polysaccharide synthesis protein [Streptococcus ruminantium]|uniref:capsular polysaccharide synthesis protein n=1 Tax=Streptococcus ruminantium TaxID=1917441 RepID=UPI0012DEBED0|nr:capsular polysaccharide synthesis protein [Streptococcus ruminantium]